MIICRHLKIHNNFYGIAINNKIMLLIFFAPKWSKDKTQVTSILEDIFNMASLVPRIAQVIISTSIFLLITITIPVIITIIMIMMIRAGPQPTWRARSNTWSWERWKKSSPPGWHLSLNKYHIMIIMMMTMVPRWWWLLWCQAGTIINSIAKRQNLFSDSDTKY